MGGLEILGDLLQDAASLTGTAEFQGACLWLLGTVFLVSGVAKIRRPALAALAIADFGATRHPKPSFGTALGAVECGLALGLVLGAAGGGALVTLSAALAAAVLWLFGLMLVRSVRAGAQFDCFCFGAGGASVSMRTVLRTVSLAALATAVAVQPGVDVGAVALGGQAITGIGIVCVLALSSRVRALATWNRDPFGLHVEAIRR